MCLTPVVTTDNGYPLDQKEVTDIYLYSLPMDKFPGNHYIENEFLKPLGSQLTVKDFEQELPGAGTGFNSLCCKISWTDW